MKEPRSRGALGSSSNGARLDNATFTKLGGSNQEAPALAPVQIFETCRQAMLRAWLAALGDIAEVDRAEEVKATVNAMELLAALDG